MPIEVLVTSTDPEGATAQMTFQLTILCGSTGPLLVGSIPDGFAVLNKLWLLDFSPFFTYSGEWDLQYSLEGLPQGSGFAVSSNGIAYGQPGLADCRALEGVSSNFIIVYSYYILLARKQNIQIHMLQTSLSKLIPMFKVTTMLYVVADDKHGNSARGMFPFRLDCSDQVCVLSFPCLF
jgi:hypothetical protein